MNQALYAHMNSKRKMNKKIKKKHGFGQETPRGTRTYFPPQPHPSMLQALGRGTNENHRVSAGVPRIILTPRPHHQVVPTGAGTASHPSQVKRTSSSW
jgi:hypothetical protein